MQIQLRELSFETKACDQDFKTLLNSDIKLTGKNCVFSLDEEIISLAGVMGGISTACSPDTKKVLVECAFFQPEAIIGKTIKYNLTSDAAYKFERGVDISLQEKALRRFIKIVQDHTSIKSLKIKTFKSGEVQKKDIPIDVERINKILGTQIDRNEYLSYLDKLGFTINAEIKIPHHRHDISSQNDLAEEVARVIGYNNINPQSFLIKKMSK